MPKNFNWKRVADFVDPSIPQFRWSGKTYLLPASERKRAVYQPKGYKVKFNEIIDSDPKRPGEVLVYEDWRHLPKLTLNYVFHMSELMERQDWLHSKAETLVKKGSITRYEAKRKMFRVAKKQKKHALQKTVAGSVISPRAKRS